MNGEVRGSQASGGTESCQPSTHDHDIGIRSCLLSSTGTPTPKSGAEPNATRNRGHNHNYPIPATEDLAGLRSAVIWCAASLMPVGISRSVL